MEYKEVTVIALNFSHFGANVDYLCTEHIAFSVEPLAVSIKLIKGVLDCEVLDRHPFYVRSEKKLIRFGTTIVDVII